MDINHIYHGSAFDVISGFESETIDCMVTDPPYGYSFMNRDWDRAIVPVETWRECLRVLKPGSFACIMSSPRQDVLAKMIVNLQDAGFRTDFTSIYWTYASGFPKASNISKLVDKRNGKIRPKRVIELEQYLIEKIKEKYPNHRVLAKEMDMDESCIRRWTGKHLDYSVSAFIPPENRYMELKQKLGLDDRFDQLIKREEAEREIMGTEKCGLNAMMGGIMNKVTTTGEYNITKSATEQAKTLDGSYGGYQPKPAVEVVLMVQKPLSEKTFVDQALRNGKGVTWLDNCRIPYSNDNDFSQASDKRIGQVKPNENYMHEGQERTKQQNHVFKEQDLRERFPANILVSDDVLGVDYSRFFSLDHWFETTFPFIITPKPSQSERNMGLDRWINSETEEKKEQQSVKNTHPTVKSIKLMCYLISLVSRPPNDLVLDPFMGSGTTAMAAQLLKRRWVGMETNKEYIEIANQRINHMLSFR